MPPRDYEQEESFCENGCGRLGKSHGKGHPRGALCQGCVRDNRTEKEEVPEGMKRCGKCKVVQPILDFYNDISRPDGLSSYCKICTSEVNRSARDKIRGGPSTPRPEIRGTAISAYVNILKSEPCMDCCGTFPPEAMDWDHRPGEDKFMDVGKLVGGRYSFDIVMAEIAKCDLVCAVCHRIRSKARLNENNFPLFIPYPKIPRLMRPIIVTEKLDGCNAKILVTGTGEIFAGGRNRWLRPRVSDKGSDPDQFGFAAWVANREEELWEELGIGLHTGEWFGYRVNRNYDLKERRFALFNPKADWDPKHCTSVPVLYSGMYSQEAIYGCVEDLRRNGSHAVPGFMRPEGVVIFHTAAKTLAKITLEKDDAPKGMVK